MSCYHEIEHQCPVLIVGVGIGIVGRLAIDATRHDEGAGGPSVLEEEAEIVAHALFCPLLIVGSSLGVAVGNALRIAVVGGGGDGAPVVGIDVAVGLALAEPVAVPVADGYLVHAVGGLVPLQGLECGQHLLGGSLVALVAGGLINLAEELHGGGDD